MGLMCALCVLFWLHGKRVVHSKTLSVTLFQLSASGVGLTFALLHSALQLEHRFEDWQGTRQCELTGEVVGLVLRKPDYQRFDLALEQARCGDANLALRTVRLSDYRAEHTLHGGARLQLQAKLKTPRGKGNDTSFDTALWALQQGIDASGYVVEYIARTEPVLSIAAIRDRLRYWLGEQGLNADAEAMLHALLLGDKSRLAQRHWEVLRNTGTVHLLVVSGLHIAIVLGLAWWLGTKVCGVLRLFLPWRLNSFAVVTALVVSFCYVQLAGAGVSTQRAWIMALIMLSTQLGAPKVTLWQRWWMALCAVLALSPMSVLSPGLWLSFAAVGALITLRHLQLNTRFAGVALRSQLYVWLALMPLLLVFFQQFSLLSPLVNLFAIPLISVVLMVLPLVLILSVIGLVWPLMLLAQLLSYIWQVLRYVSEFAAPLMVSVGRLDEAALLLLCFYLLLLLLPIAVRLKVVVLFAGLLLFQPKELQSVAQGTFKVHVFDVGQGLAVLVQTANGVLLFDTAARFSSGYSYAKGVIVPHLMRLGISHLDLVIVSHSDNDHAGGIRAIEEGVSVAAIDSGTPSELDTVVRQCESGRTLHWGGTVLSYRHPHAGGKWRVNDKSCALEVSTLGCSLLLLGDAGTRVERQITLSKYRGREFGLLLGHHGSRHSSAEGFLDRLKPDFAVASSGYNNRYQHPHPEVLSRLAERGIRLYRTDLEGAITVSGDQSGCEMTTWRRRAVRFWHPEWVDKTGD
ncbi:MAG: DNA internalization-related competence protein ComEC/Rec2 [Pseudomonadales bacterium]